MFELASYFIFVVRRFNIRNKGGGARSLLIVKIYTRLFSTTELFMATPQPAGESIRSEVYFDIIKSYVKPSEKGRLKLVVVGEAGQGKSTLINGLLGKEVANEGDQFDAGTAEIKYYCLDQNGISVQIWDTPGFGFGSEEEDQKMVEQLRMSECFPHDLALFCFKMDDTRFPKRIHTDTVKTLTQVFGKNFWKHTMFVLTFANAVSHLCPPGEELEFFFSNRVGMLEEKIHTMLRKTVPNLSDDVVRKIRAVPVGSYKKGGCDPCNPWLLPDRQDWFVWFWIECTEHMRQAALTALLQANRHRIKIDSETAPTYGQDPSLTNKEAYERSVVEPPPRSPEVTEEDDNDDDDGVGHEGYGGLEEPYEESLTAPLRPAREDDKPPPKDLTESIKSDEIPLATENLTDSPHARPLPIYEMLRRQLDDKDSSFYQYVKEYAKKRGESVWFAGHVYGMIEGFCEWLGKRGRLNTRQRHQCNSTN